MFWVIAKGSWMTNFGYIGPLVMVSLLSNLLLIIRVKLGQDLNTGDWYAIKIMKEHQVNTPEKLLYFMNEVRILSQSSQKHVVEIISASVSGTLVKSRGVKKTAVYYAMCYAKYGELYRLIKETGRVTEMQARSIFSQLLDGNLHNNIRLGVSSF